MLDKIEKQEMLEDAMSIKRRDDFRFSNQFPINLTFDEYLNFLSGLQKIFGAFPISQKITKTDLNKL